MAIDVISFFTHRTSIDTGPWTDAHHSVNQYVDAIKQRPVNGYGHVLVNGTLPKRRISAVNAASAVDWFGEMAHAVLVDAVEEGPLVLVPVPNSKCAVGVSACRTRDLADAAASRFGDQVVVADVLRWDQEMKSASEEGGTRDPAILLPHLVQQGEIPVNARIVLIDDVLTTGGHIRACAAFLVGQGYAVIQAICAARSDGVPVEDPFIRRTDTLETFIPE